MHSDHDQNQSKFIHMLIMKNLVKVERTDTLQSMTMNSDLLPALDTSAAGADPGSNTFNFCWLLNKYIL